MNTLLQTFTFCFHQIGSRAIFKRGFIILSLLFLSGEMMAQTNRITGIIIDSTTSAPVEGAIVAIKGTSIGTATDTSGQFVLNAPAELPFTIVVNILGYKPQQIEVTELNNIPLNVILVQDEDLVSTVVISARRRDETLQNVPIPVSVIGGNTLEQTGAFNVNRVKELVPSVQLYSSNPRNTALNIRGLGSPFGLTNDGIDPGVGFYVDGVYYARPAAATLDFIDIERIEVLRGPQGTLFGKNTTAGAFNIVTRAPSFKPGGTFEVSYGNYGYIQAKASVTGPLSQKFAARFSFSGTQRDGVIYNKYTNTNINDLNNIGFRGQVLYKVSDKVKITFAADATRQRPTGYAQVIAGVAPTKRAAYRQFNAIIADLNYQLPTLNPYDRVVDQNTAWKSNNDLGGASINIDAKIGGGTLTSTTAWRYWKWDPSNDRDFTGLAALSRSEGTSRQNQFTQEIRYAGDFSNRLSGVIGVFAFGQNINSGDGQTEESGSAQWRFSQSSTSALWSTPGLFDGYGIKTKATLNSFSGAVFGQLDWAITSRLHLLGGLRYNYDYKDVDYNRTTYGGLQTTDPALIALQQQVYSNQAFKVNAKNTNISGQLTASYKVSNSINTYATYANSYKPVGVNLGGLPTTGTPARVMTELATVKPEYVNNIEIGVKTTPTKNSVLNFAVFNTDVKDYQTQVQSPEIGVNRGYLANAEHVRVRGFEVDGNIRVNKNLSFFGALAYTEGEYVKFTNAPLPLEETGSATAFKDISGSTLPGISKWIGTIGGEVSLPGKLVTKSGEYFLAVDNYNRSGFSSSPTPSAYLNVEGYSLVNARLGFRAKQGLTVFVWSRNLFNQNYMEQLLPAGGNAGQYAAVLGDPRTFGTTLRYTF